MGNQDVDEIIAYWKEKEHFEGYNNTIKINKIIKTDLCLLSAQRGQSLRNGDSPRCAGTVPIVHNQ